MKLEQNSDGTVATKTMRFRAVALFAAIVGGATALAQPALEVENEAVIEAGRGQDVIIRASKQPVIASPARVIVAAPDEEIILDTEPAISGEAEAPARPKLKGQKENKDSVERRLDRLERMIENLAERDRIRLKNGPFEFNQKEFGRVQKETERASREADIAMKRFRGGPGTDDNFVFEHKFSIAGDGKMQKKALEAQRKALEKQLEAVNRRLRSIEGKEEKRDEDQDEEIRKEKKITEPSLPPE